MVWARHFGFGSQIPKYHWDKKGNVLCSVGFGFLLCKVGIRSVTSSWAVEGRQQRRCPFTVCHLTAACLGSGSFSLLLQRHFRLGITPPVLTSAFTLGCLRKKWSSWKRADPPAERGAVGPEVLSRWLASAPFPWISVYWIWPEGEMIALSLAFESPIYCFS